MMYEVIPTPGDDHELLLNEELHVTYPLYQSGDWFIGLQVGKLEQNLEADGRFLLMSYWYDPGAMTVRFRLRRNPNPPAKVQLAGSGTFIVGALLGIITTVAVYFAYTTKQEVKVYREGTTDLINDPNTPDSIKEKLEHLQEEADEAGGLPAMSDVADAGKALAGAGGLIALAVIAYLVLGD